MPSYEVVLRRRESVAEGTLAFDFSKPAGFEFAPGQAVDVALSDPAAPGSYGMKHTFSLASAPREADLTIATRMRDSAFKRVLSTLEPGARARIDGPFGSFALDPGRPAILIAGGIGITPFRSMLRDLPAEAEGAPIVLFYSNPRPRDVAFLEELDVLAAASRRFKLVATMTKVRNSSVTWGGESGRITRALLERHGGSFESPIYYVVGPPAMVEGICATLASMGIRRSEVRREEFFGY